MKRSILIIFIIPVVVLSSCKNIIHSDVPTDFTLNRDKQIVFFSDDKNIDREAIYYDALLVIKEDFPEEFENMRVISENMDKHLYEVDTYPSLLVVSKKEILVQIEGTVLSKEEILEPVSNALLE
ncbi:hypothetical protein [Metabacillus halosaccharovorans]|uniref:Small peptidoglycan-associated lipoprotein n=1 Tax=Metabacillus halosaccharovorans TaxID=930124 RepID=A0ABT3DLH9_9BACI|nr:hypothetical protein [Metabacillus halosaccharovorans]MCV9887502.1 hypothetical protein [Metabacillus halosaccharovorans]